MTRFVIFALALAISFAGATAMADPTSQPTSQSTTQPAHFPTPSELLAKMRADRVVEDAKAKVAYFDLSDGVAEKPADFSLFASQAPDTLHTLIQRLHKARDDKDIRAVLIVLGEGGVGLADAQEIRDTLADIAAHKKVYVYADGYDTIGYTLASGASDICMLAGGEIMIPGVGFSTMFYKGAFDKLGVEADYVQIGKYKGAKEPYTNSEPSEELRGELNRLTENLYGQIVSGIAEHRKLSTDAVKQIIDDTMISGDAAKDRGLVDHLLDEDGLRPMIETQLGGTIDLIQDYGQDDQEQVDLSSPFALFSLLSRKPEVSHKPAVALIYAQGVITDGEGGGSLLEGSSGVASDPMRRAFRAAAHDDSIKAIVIRIDSPGGSALASEVMWQAVRRVAVKKPVIISVGGMAASGGYYLASAGDTIFADPVGIVGSIGVVGGKFVLKDLYAKLGLTTETFSKGQNAGLFSQDAPFSDKQRDMVQRWMQDTYTQFTHRVMTTRSGKIKDIDQVAQGRIFLAPQAKELGLIDEIGGTEAAIACAADRGGLAAGDYEIRVLPAPRTLADLFTKPGAQTASPINPPSTVTPLTATAASIFGVLDPSARTMLENQLQMVQLLQHRPIMLMSPYVFSLK